MEILFQPNAQLGMQMLVTVSAFYYLSMFDIERYKLKLPTW